MRAVLWLVVALLGCDDGGGDDDEPSCDAPAATLGGEFGLQACVFQRSCTFSSCHGGTTPQLELSLATAEASCAGLVGVESQQVVGRVRVVPGRADASYLLDKLAGADGVVGTLMPPPSGGLSEARIEAVRAWIAAGAPCD